MIECAYERQVPCSDVSEKSIFHLVKIRDKQKLINTITVENLNLDVASLDEQGETPLIVACKHKRIANAFTLLDFYSEKSLPGFISSSGFSAIYFSINSSNFIERMLTYDSVLETLHYVYPCNNNLLTLMLSKGITSNLNTIVDAMDLESLNHRNNNGKTALILAAEIGEYDICRKLIIKGVNLAIYDNDGYNAIAYLKDNISENATLERINLCFLICDTEQILAKSSFREYSNSDFVSIGKISIPNIICAYGELKWGLTHNGEVKIIKFFKSYKNGKIMPPDFIKELVYIKELNQKMEGIINLEGVYSDENDIHLVFEPLAITFSDYFKLVKLQVKIEENEMSKLRMEKAFSTLNLQLKAIHKCGILHNDIKFSNVMIGYGGKIKVIDFGISDFLGLAPYERVTCNYLTTSSIKAPDFGQKTTIKIFEKNENDYNCIKSYIFKSARKSYNSDVYSLGVSFIQAILANTKKYVSIGGQIFEVLNFKEKKDLNLIAISKEDSLTLNSYSFFDDLIRMINIDGNLRIKRESISYEEPINEFKSKPCYTQNYIQHYSKEELKNQSYELIYANDIFSNYSNYSIFHNSPGFLNRGSEYKKDCVQVFSRILKVIENKISIDTYYNAIYNSINYNGICNLEVLCIANLYLFASIFEWKVPSIEIIAEEFNLPVDILIGNVNYIISTLILDVKIIPFVTILEFMLIKMQVSNVSSNLLSNIEDEILKNLFFFISGSENYLIRKEVYIWDFVQCFSYGTCSFLPFEVQYNSDSIIDLFSKVYS